MDNAEQIKKEIDDLKQKIEDMSRIISSHTHSGNDGSTYIYQDSVKLKTEQYYRVGNFILTESTNNDGSQEGFLVVGTDENTQDGSSNAQITIEHQPQTDSVQKQTFMYGFRGKIYSGTNCNVVAGDDKLTQNEFEFIPDDLVGQYVNVKYDSGLLETYQILENSKKSLTIAGQWSQTQTKATFFIFMPVYLGAADYPWRRIYTGDGSAGGVRFGYGATGGGQNGLLYMGTSGNLMWRSPDGTTNLIA